MNCPRDGEKLQPIFSSNDVLWCWRCLNVYEDTEHAPHGFAPRDTPVRTTVSKEVEA